MSFTLNIKKYFDYLFFTSQWHNNSERLCSSLQLFTSLFPAVSRSDFMALLPQITYGNIALIVLSYSHAYKKKGILFCRLLDKNVFKCCHSVTKRSISPPKKKIYFFKQ
jgi:hypothetical protein